MTANNPLLDIQTPALVLDERKMMRNIARLSERMQKLGVSLRPHMKTAKSVDVARRQLEGGNGPATVSTLREAEVLFAAGVKDILYAVGIAPVKLARVLALRAAGCDLKIILDSTEQAEAAVAAARGAQIKIPALIEIDSDGHRGGVAPNDDALLAIGKKLHAEGMLAGVVTHAGESYNAAGRAAHIEFAERERNAVVTAASRLRAAGLPCPVVSVGSSPTAHAAQNLDGVTEVRAGVYVFFDLVMAGIGVCDVDDIAISVLTSVIGHQRERGWILIDAGWMAMSRDRGTANQAVDQGYGLVCDIDGKSIPDLIVASANQEHGIVALRAGSSGKLPELPVGTRLRILPNHACATAAQFDRYHVVPQAQGAAMIQWSRFSGW
ncbi:MAG TPA: DSD1 family PLP-dependent enzyme [Xanthobacteraceae bacterium]|nr:DSD1 family PLP-dependent enzyme [Xanthobacteraceae bacterium]